jgi:hypothetical protein
LNELTSNVVQNNIIINLLMSSHVGTIIVGDECYSGGVWGTTYIKAPQILTSRLSKASLGACLSYFYPSSPYHFMPVMYYALSYMDCMEM